MAAEVRADRPTGARDDPEPDLEARKWCDRNAAAQRSDWGLFQRTVDVVRDGAGQVYKSLLYDCEGQDVELRKPVSGEGTKLMYGDFARKLSFAEEALAFYIVKHRHLFAGCRVLDIGAGLGFAGLVCAICCDAAYVEITDGDPEVVRTLQASASLNRGRFGNTEVVVRDLPFNEHQFVTKLDRASFDIVIAADIVYAAHFHDVILDLVARVLRPQGSFVLFSPRRGTSLSSFASKAKITFQYSDEFSNYDPVVSKVVSPLPKCFPIMVSAGFSQATRNLWRPAGHDASADAAAPQNARSQSAAALSCATVRYDSAVTVASRPRSRPVAKIARELAAEKSWGRAVQRTAARKLSEMPEEQLGEASHSSGADGSQSASARALRPRSQTERSVGGRRPSASQTSCYLKDEDGFGIGGRSDSLDHNTLDVEVSGPGIGIDCKVKRRLAHSAGSNRVQGCSAKASGKMTLVDALGCTPQAENLQPASCNVQRGSLVDPEIAKGASVSSQQGIAAWWTPSSPWWDTRICKEPQPITFRVSL